MYFMAVQDKLYTADDLWEMSHQVGDQKRLELIKGVIVEMSPAGDVHGVVAAWLLHLIITFVAAHDLGDVTAAETGFVLFAGTPQTVLAPDVGFVSKKRRPRLTGKYYSVAPDLAVEVVSPTDTAKDVREKVELYLRYGTSLVWVVYPDSRLVDVHRPNHATVSYGIGGELDGGDVLPGFRLLVKEIFARLHE
jgi:Uma2 family endonuclease